MILTESHSVLSLPTKEYRGYVIPFLLYVDIMEANEKIARAEDAAAYWKRNYEAKQSWYWRPPGGMQTLLDRFQELAPEAFAVALISAETRP
jgi:hypothetical protein